MDILILVRYAVIKHEKTLNIEAYRLRHRNWRKKNIDELNIYFWNRRGLRYNITGKLLQDKFIEQDKKCYYCNVKLKYPNFQIEHTTPKDNSSNKLF